MNAFEQLRAPLRPVEPDRRFVERLRADLTAAVRAAGAPTVALPARAALPTADATSTSDTTDDTDRSTMSNTTSRAAVSTPSEAIGEATLVPYLAVRGAAEAIRWYQAVFHAVEMVRYTGDDGRIGHAELSIGGATVYLSDEYLDYDAASPDHLGGTAVALNLVVADVDTVFGTAVASGATARREPTDQAYGERSCTLIDPWGHRWVVQTTIATPTIAEIDASMEGFTVTPGDTAGDDGDA